MLTAAGFKVLPVNTPQRLASFKQLPPHQFSRQIRDGQVFYVYSDPTVCGCLYVGDQAAYGTYRKYAFEKQLANEQAMTANEIAMTWIGGLGRLAVRLVLGDLVENQSIRPWPSNSWVARALASPHFSPAGKRRHWVKGIAIGRG